MIYSNTDNRAAFLNEMRRIETEDEREPATDEEAIVATESKWFQWQIDGKPYTPAFEFRPDGKIVEHKELPCFLRKQAGESVKFDHHSCDGNPAVCDCDLTMLEAIDPDWTDHDCDPVRALREYRKYMSDQEWNVIVVDLNG